MDKIKTIQKFNEVVYDVQDKIVNNKNNPGKCKQQRKVKQINSYFLTSLSFHSNQIYQKRNSSLKICFRKFCIKSSILFKFQGIKMIFRIIFSTLHQHQFFSSKNKDNYGFNWTFEMDQEVYDKLLKFCFITVKL